MAWEVLVFARKNHEEQEDGADGLPYLAVLEDAVGGEVAWIPEAPIGHLEMDRDPLGDCN